MALPTTEQLSKASRADLLKLRSDVDEALRVNEQQDKANTKSTIDKILAEAGYALTDIYGNAVGNSAGGAGKRAYMPREGSATKTPVAPKYRHPENPEITYSGRGRKPGWFADYVSQHGQEKAEADLTIK